MKICRPLFFASLTLIVALCLPCAALGQSSTATLSGSVVDANGAVVPGAKVTVTNPATGLQREAVTDERGVFTVPLLPPSTYTISVEAQGFAPAEVKGVVLNVGDQRSLKVELKVGQLGATVDVKSDAPLINESPAVGTVVDRQFVENIPLNGRSFQPLISLAPGVVVTKASVGEQGQFSVNGQRASANYFTVDGASANYGVIANTSLSQTANGALPAFGATGGTSGLVSVDAMQEFQIQTSTYAPEFGRTSGAQVSIATRSGTNEFRGTVFEYFRNDALDANDWFNNRNRLKKPALRQNDFGGVFGGPLWKNRAFFFFSYEGLRLRLPQTQITIVPSTASRTAAVAAIRPFLNAYPVPNGQTFANNTAEFIATYSDPSSLDAFSIRLDHKINDRVSVFGRYNNSPSKTSERGLRASNVSLSVISDTKFENQSLTLGSSQSLNSSIVNEVRGNFARSEGSNGFTTDNFGGAVPLTNSSFMPSGFSNENSLLLFQVSGVRGVFIGKNATNIQRQFNLIDNLSVVKGPHQLKLGIDYRMLRPTNGPREYRQTAFFSNVTNASNGTASSATVGALDKVELSVTNFSAYAQDVWKTNQRLTLTYGMRWDVNPALKGRGGKVLYTLMDTKSFAAPAFAPAGTPLYETTYSNFAPRIGASFQLVQKPGRETVLRGGFGVFYDLGLGSVATAATSFPYSRLNRFANVAFPLTPTQAAQPPFSLTLPTSGGSLEIADRNLKLPRTYQWNFAVEQSIGSHQTFTASYVGAAGRKLLRRSVFLTPTFLSVNLTDNGASSDYHAMQLQYQRRLSDGLQVLASYTWSHSIDIASNESFQVSSPLNPKLDRGSSDFDVRHAFNAGLTYDISAPKSGSLLRALLKDWSTDAIVTTRSATPIDLIGSQDTAGGVLSLARPDLVPGVPLYIYDPSFAGGRRFNRAAFVAAPAGRQGTFGRNVMRGLPVFQVDMALRRQFNLTERVKLQLKAEAFNIFNHPNFGDPPSNFDGNFLPSALFGQSTSMLGRSLGTGGVSGGFNPLYQVGGPRSIQLAAKIQF